MLSCAIICKNEEKHLERLLSKLKPHVDEIVVVDTGSTDKSIKIAKKYATVYKKEWVDFSDARNYAFSKCTHKYILWLDCDDDIEGAEKLRELADEAQERGLAGWGFKYNYARDEKGNILSVQWRERLIDKTQFEWKGKIHESACQTTKNPVHRSEEVVINHLATLEDMKKSNKRNLEMLLSEYEQDKDKTDPRTLYYIAQTYKGLREWEKSAKFYTLYIPQSGWDEEKAQAWHSLADCMRYLKKFDEAIIADMECLKILPDWPDGFLGVADTYFFKADNTNNPKDWKNCLEWLKAGFTKKMPDTIRVIEPQRYTWMPTLQMAIAQLNLGQVDEAYELYMKAYSLSNGHEFIAQHYALFEEFKEREKAVKGLLEYTEFAKKYANEVLENLPRILVPKLLDDPRIERLKLLYTPPVTWAKDEIVIFCPFGYEEWADPSVIKGIGGSEEAVIYLSREFVKKGYKVTVFNTCGKLAGTYNGVIYKNLSDFNPNDEFNIFISWRNPLPLARIKAKVKWAWIHDVPQNPDKEYSPQVLEKLDKVVVLSKYHRSLIPMVPDEKVLISNNGIVPEHFKEVEKEPNTIFWGSSYDRGLHCLLRDIIPLIKKEIPDVKLHVCYGWNTFLKMNSENEMAMAWKYKMDELLNQDCIEHHGRVGHRKLAKIMGECQVWAYPTEFDEINCITAQKAQSAGCVPVTTDRAALNETNVQGFKIYGHKIYTSTVQQKEFAKKIIEQLKNPIKIDTQKAVNDFGWERTCDQWIKNFK